MADGDFPQREAYWTVLTRAEVEEAEAEGNLRQYRAVKSGRKPNYGFKGAEDEQLRRHIHGALGEHAVSKVTGVPWRSTEGQFKRGFDLYKIGDDKAGFEVRARSRFGYELQIRFDEDLTRAYVLALGNGAIFAVMGWAWGYEAQRDEWVHDYGNRGSPAWFIPHAMLHDMVDLPFEVTGTREPPKSIEYPLTEFYELWHGRKL